MVFDCSLRGIDFYFGVIATIQTSRKEM